MTHAEKELEALEKTVEDAIIAPFKEEIIALCAKFNKSGQSGGSAPYTAKAISQAVEKLMLQQTIAPLTGEDLEWADMSEYNDDKIMYQNLRDSRVFKYKDNSCYFIDAIVFDGDVGGAFTGNGSVKHNGKTISSSQKIKSFPFTPKTFYIDVIDYRWKDKEETTLDKNGDWWTHEIKDPSQLKEVAKYYNI